MRRYHVDQVLFFCNGFIVRAWQHMFGKNVESIESSATDLVSSIVNTAERDLFFLTQGVRSKKASQWLYDPTSVHVMLVHTISQRPCERLLHHFFKQEKEECWRGLQGQPVPLQDLASVAFSPAARCIEEFISLLAFSDPCTQALLQGREGECGSELALGLVLFCVDSIVTASFPKTLRRRGC